MHIKHKILNQGYTQVDETPIRVLDRNKKGKTHQGYYWVYNAPLLSAVFFDYRPGRGADGSLEIDNNLVENALRPNAIGRKNYLFAGSHEGTKRAAMFYTFFGMCKMHDVNPWQWMKKVLEIIPEHKVTRLEELLPQNMNLDQ